MNNAVLLNHSVIDDASVDEFDRVFVVNVLGVFAVAKEAACHTQQGGRIINIGSVDAERAGFSGQTIYIMSKAAVTAMTPFLARDSGQRGI